MSKLASIRQHKISRTGSYATRLSATGKDTLGYGAGAWDSDLPVEERRQVLIKRKSQLIGEAKACKPGPHLKPHEWLRQEARRKDVVAQITDIERQLSEIKALAKAAEREKELAGRPLQACIVDVCKARFSTEQWAEIVAEARRMQETYRRASVAD